MIAAGKLVQKIGRRRVGKLANRAIAKEHHRAARVLAAKADVGEGPITTAEVIVIGADAVADVFGARTCCIITKMVVAASVPYAVCVGLLPREFSNQERF